MSEEYNRRNFLKLGATAGLAMTTAGCAASSKQKPAKANDLGKMRKALPRPGISVGPDNVIKIGDFEVSFISHVFFQFKSPDGKILLTDCFLADGFTYQDRWEKRLNMPAVKAEDIKKADVIFITHEHGDHYDPDAIQTIVKNTGALVIAPAVLTNQLKEREIEQKFLFLAIDRKRYNFGDMHLYTYANANSRPDKKGKPTRFSAIIETGNTKLFYSGDCHSLPPSIIGKTVDAMFCWPYQTDEGLIKLCSGLKTNTFIIMHFDEFEPGCFLCNLDTTEEKQRVENLVPAMKAIVPKRVKKLP